MIDKVEKKQFDDIRIDGDTILVKSPTVPGQNIIFEVKGISDDFLQIKNPTIADAREHRIEVLVQIPASLQLRARPPISPTLILEELNIDNRILRTCKRRALTAYLQSRQK